ncbi:hypothetical protein Pmani_030764 [Petrolisthes manimaculis]|uniref:Uncharacterized protein n=1 Tax=Petrolisthes manimaculis TaxID=1843537 RepID=A0AAE1TT60_9EUCA|nr:hypothetical protein Pmani_030764 [Petrolisthes manimaculis]
MGPRASVSAMMGVGLVRVHGETLLADQLRTAGTPNTRVMSSWQRTTRCTTTLSTNTRSEPRVLHAALHVTYRFYYKQK